MGRRKGHINELGVEKTEGVVLFSTGFESLQTLNSCQKVLNSHLAVRDYEGLVGRKRECHNVKDTYIDSFP